LPAEQTEEIDKRRQTNATALKLKGNDGTVIAVAKVSNFTGSNESVPPVTTQLAFGIQ
jgi:hypothetical protein